MKIIITIFFCMSLVATAFSQRINEYKINDSLYERLVVDSITSAWKNNADTKTYVYFDGFFNNEFVAVKKNAKILFSDTVSTVDTAMLKVKARLAFVMKEKKRENAILEFQFDSIFIKLPLLKGYRYLNISESPSIVNGRNVQMYIFEYFNRPKLIF